MDREANDTAALQATSSEGRVVPPEELERLHAQTYPPRRFSELDIVVDTLYWPNDLVIQLVEWAICYVLGTDLLPRVGVLVSTSPSDYHGLCNRPVPQELRSWPHMRDKEVAIQLWLSPATKFPLRATVQRWREVTLEEVRFYGDRGLRSISSDGKRWWIIENDGPDLVYADWEEYLIGTAAHEASHALDFLQGRESFEDEAGKWSVKIIEVWRARK